MKNLTRFKLVFAFLLVVSMAKGQNMLTISEAGDQPVISTNPNGTIGVTFGNGKDIYFAYSNDNGKSFSASEKVATFDGLVLGMSSGPRLAMSDDYYSIVAPDRKGDLSAWRRRADAKKWEGPFKVNDVPGSSGESLADITFDGKGNLYATWIDTRRAMEGHESMGHDMAGGKEIKEYDAGPDDKKVVKQREPEKAEMNHDMPTPLTQEQIMKEVGEMPEGAKGISQYRGPDGKMYWVVLDEKGNALKAKDMESYKAFKAKNAGRRKPEGKIFISKSTDAGITWAKSQFVYASPDGSVCECCKPSIIAGDNGLFIMFRNNVDGNRDLYVTKSTNEGTSFSDPEKLGVGSWAINGCPMDGGNLDVNGDKVATVWQREGKVYFATPGVTEELLGSGRAPAVASNEKGNYILWNSGPNVMAQLPNRSGAVNLGKGAAPKVVSLPNGQGALAIWVDGDKVVAKRLS